MKHSIERRNSYVIVLLYGKIVLLHSKIVLLYGKIVLF